MSLASDTTGAFTATLNLNNNKLILQTTTVNKTTSLTSLASALASGYHGGDWLGTGITGGSVAIDASATGGHLLTLALYDNADLNLTTFGGQSVGTTSLLITTALIGDTNFDGFVNEADLNVVSNNFQTSQAAASRGDLNFDGTVNNADLHPVQNRLLAVCYSLRVWSSSATPPLAASLGTVTITANYNYTGSATIAAGTLMIGNGGTSGSPGIGSLINNSRLAFNRSDTLLFP